MNSILNSGNLLFSLNSRKKLAIKRLIATTKSVSNLSRFKSVSDSKLNELKIKWMKKRTYNKVQWAVRTFKEWHNVKLGSPVTFDPLVLEVDIDVMGSLTKENFCHALCKFIPEVTKKKDASDYPGKTLYEMVVALQKHINQKGIPWKLLDDPEFLMVKNVLDNVMKERALANVGMTTKQAEFITEEFEGHLWDTGVLGEDTGEKLRDTVLFLLGINLALHAGDEHYDLRRDCPEKNSQLSFERDHNSGKRCMVYREDTQTMEE